MTCKNLYFLSLTLALLIMGGGSSVAADNASVAKNATTQVEKEKPPVELRSDEELFEQSLLMSPQDDIAINRALQGIEGSDAGRVNAREIRLAGISYEGPHDWILWLNGKRLVPGTMLPEIVELTVYPEYIHLKWFDQISNEIIIIELRSNQVYDIQSNILLPG